VTQYLASPVELARVEAVVDAWLAEELLSNNAIVDVTRDGEVDRRWYVRLAGDERDFTTIWFTLGQRTLKYESYVLAAPEENHAGLFQFLLRQNFGLVGVRFAVGPEDAIFLTGESPFLSVDGDELDRIVGTIFEAVERFFKPMLRIGFASRFK